MANMGKYAQPLLRPEIKGGDPVKLAKYSAPYNYGCLPPPEPITDYNQNTLYSDWRVICECTNEEYASSLMNSQYVADRCAGHAICCCMSPIYVMDRCIYKCCCCGSSQNCNCTSNVCFSCFVVLPISLVKIPFVALAWGSSHVAGCVGLTYEFIRNKVNPAQEAPMLVGDKRGHWRPRTLDESRGLYELFVKYLKRGDLLTIVKFKKKRHGLAANFFRYLHDRHLDVALFTLLIRYENQEVSLEDRQQYIVELLRIGVPIDGYPIPSYRNRLTRFMVPLYEAMVSKYKFAPELLKLLIKHKADYVNCKILVRDKDKWELVSISEWGYLRYSSFDFETQKDVFWNKLKSIPVQGSKEPVVIDYRNYYKVRDFLERRLGKNVVDLIGQNSCRFFRPYQSDAEAKRENLRAGRIMPGQDPFQVLVEFPIDERGFRVVPQEYLQTLPEYSAPSYDAGVGTPF